MGSIARMDLTLPSKGRDVSWPSPSPPTPNSKSFFQSERPEPPPPPPPPLTVIYTLKIIFEEQKLGAEVRREPSKPLFIKHSLMNVRNLFLSMKFSKY